MATVYLDRDDDTFLVSWHTLPRLIVRRFELRNVAEAYAVKKMGKTGMIVSTLDLTSEQLAAHEDRQEQFRERLAETECDDDPENIYRSASMRQSCHQ